VQGREPGKPFLRAPIEVDIRLAVDGDQLLEVIRYGVETPLACLVRVQAK